MKIRTDFVTNSSSSSFIIRKSEKFKTKDDLFKFIQEQYRTLLEDLEKAKKYCEEKGHPIITKNGCVELDRESFKDIYDRFDFKYEVKEKTGFDFDRLYYFNLFDIEKILKAESYEEFIKNRATNDQIIFDGLKEVEKYEDHWAKDELTEWYSDKVYLPEYFIAGSEEIEKILDDSLIIYDSDGGPYHFRDIQDELGEICVIYCTHMG